MNNRTITVTESRVVQYMKESKTYTYEEIRELFATDDECLVIQLLNRVEKLESLLEDYLNERN